MDYSTIRLNIDANIAVITLDRPDVMNALSTQMRAEILDAVKSAEREARVIVLTGAGDAFCSGQDLGGGRSLASMDVERTLRAEYIPMLKAIADSPLPVIAAVNGPAVGAGASLALSADVVIATESAVFMQAFTRIGLMPDAGATYWLPRQVGFARAMGAALFAEPVSAKDAAQWGMIWEAVPDADFAAHWRARAEKLASGPSVSYQHTKEAMRASFDKSFDEQLLLESRLQGRCGKTRDFREGVLAFTEKRPASFEGR